MGNRSSSPTTSRGEHEGEDGGSAESLVGKAEDVHAARRGDNTNDDDDGNVYRWYEFSGVLVSASLSCTAGSPVEGQENVEVTLSLMDYDLAVKLRGSDEKCLSIPFVYLTEIAWDHTM